MPMSSAFLSYHHNDRIIGETVHDQLSFLAGCGKGKSWLKCFLDVREIPHGTPWKPVIDDNLGSHDWMVVIFTGEESPFCGYEVGTFMQLHAKKEDSRITTVHDVLADRLPLILKDRQNVLVPDVAKPATLNNVTVLADEVAVWFHSSLGEFLVEFCRYKALYTADDEREPGTFAVNIAQAAKTIATAYALARGTDRLVEIFSQIGFRLVIPGVGGSRIEVIPDSAPVFGSTLFFDVLGLRLGLSSKEEPSTDWGGLKRLLETSNGRDAPWMHKIEADVVRAVDSRTVSGDDVTFRGENGKVYRPILERHELYVNGDRHFFLLFVETLDRRFVGSMRSSLLLTSLILASRWRFTYFEKWTETQEGVFASAASLSSLTDSCRQLFYNIEWIELEAAELGAANVKAMIDAFGPSQRARIERVFKEWEDAKAELHEILPGLKADVTDANRERIQEAVLAFLRATGQNNEEFLTLALQAYADEVKLHDRSAFSLAHGRDHGGPTVAIPGGSARTTNA